MLTDDDEQQLNTGSILGDQVGLKTTIKDNKKAPNAISLGYPSRYQLIGFTNCFFFKWYQKGKVPLITIGPSKLPCFLLILFAIFIFCYLAFLMTLFSHESIMATRVCSIGILMNVLTFFTTMLREPGVPKSVYERYYKLKYVKQKEIHEDEL